MYNEAEIKTEKLKAVTGITKVCGNRYALKKKKKKNTFIKIKCESKYKVELKQNLINTEAN